MDPLTISALASAGAGIVQGVTGAVQKAQAKKIARKNKRPVYSIQKPILDNQDLIESRAGQGLSDAALQIYREGAERGLTSSIDAILAGGGSVNNIGDLYGNYADNISKVALLDEEMRTKNVQNLIDQNNTLAGEKDKEWQVNIWGPYADKAQAAASLSKQGTDNMWKGINTVLGAGSSLAAGNEFKSEGDNVYGNNGRLPDEMTSIPDFGWRRSAAEKVPYERPTPSMELRNKYPGLILGNSMGRAWEYE